MKTNEHYGIGINTAKVVGVMFFGAICFATGYYSGWRDRAVKLAPAQLSEVEEQGEASQGVDLPSPSVKPLKARPSVQLPLHHPPIPETDEHGHPSFDCRSLKAELTQAKGAESITQLFENRAERQGRVVSLNAIVIGAYYKILGTNWYHLCDAPSGQVLVISSKQVVEPRTLIKISGALSVDYDLSGVYRFPLYIKEAKISGQDIQAPEESPEGVIKL